MDYSKTSIGEQADSFDLISLKSVGKSVTHSHENVTTIYGSYADFAARSMRRKLGRPWELLGIDW
jgi:hypothetical protein